MAATVKHFAGYGAPVAGREYNTVDMSTQQLVQRLPAAVQGGGRRRRGDGDERVQLAQRRARDAPTRTLLQHDPPPGVGLRRHRRQRLPGDPGARGVRLRRQRRRRGAAGLDRGRGHRDGGRSSRAPISTYTNNGPALLRQGKITMAQFNNAVRHVLTLKYLAGMFDHPFTDPNRVTTRRADAGEPGGGPDKRRPLDGAAERRQQGAAAEHRHEVDRGCRPAGQRSAPTSSGPTSRSATTSRWARSCRWSTGSRRPPPTRRVTTAPGCDPNCTSDAGFADAVNAAAERRRDGRGARRAGLGFAARRRRAATSACPATSSSWCSRSPPPASPTWSC